MKARKPVKCDAPPPKRVEEDVVVQEFTGKKLVAVKTLPFYRQNEKYRETYCGSKK